MRGRGKRKAVARPNKGQDRARPPCLLGRRHRDGQRIGRRPGRCPTDRHLCSTSSGSMRDTYMAPLSRTSPKPHHLRHGRQVSSPLLPAPLQGREGSRGVFWHSGDIHRSAWGDRTGGKPPPPSLLLPLDGRAGAVPTVRSAREPTIVCERPPEGRVRRVGRRSREGCADLLVVGRGAAS